MQIWTWFFKENVKFTQKVKINKEINNENKKKEKKKKPKTEGKI